MLVKAVNSGVVESWKGGGVGRLTFVVFCCGDWVCVDYRLLLRYNRASQLKGVFLVNRSIEVVVRVWLRGSSREVGFCGQKWLFRNPVAVRRWLAPLLKSGEVLEFAGCGWHLVKEGEKYYWSRCKWLE